MAPKRKAKARKIPAKPVRKAAAKTARRGGAPRPPRSGY